MNKADFLRGAVNRSDSLFCRLGTKLLFIFFESSSCVLVCLKMIGVRVSSFSEGTLGEPEQDANSALTELDKG